MSIVGRLEVLKRADDDKESAEKARVAADIARKTETGEKKMAEFLRALEAERAELGALGITVEVKEPHPEGPHVKFVSLSNEKFVITVTAYDGKFNVVPGTWEDRARGISTRMTDMEKAAESLEGAETALAGILREMQRRRYIK